MEQEITPRKGTGLDYIDSSDIDEKRMLDCIEMLNYSSKYTGTTFIIGVMMDANIHNLIYDLRVLQLSGINTHMIISAEMPDFTEAYNELSLLFSQIIEVETSDESAIINLFQNKTLPESDFLLICKSVNKDYDLLRNAFELSREKNIKRVMFIGSPEKRFIEINGKISYHIHSHTLDDILQQKSQCSLSYDSLELIRKNFEESLTDVVFLNSETGALFREIFTYRGHGTLISNSDQNVVRTATEGDIVDIMMIMRPDIISGDILPISIRNLKRLLSSFQVYCIGQSIVAFCAVIDYGDGCELSKFCTLPRFRGKGRAKELALKLIDKAKEQNKKYVFALSVSKKMALFFISLGFVEINRNELPPEWKKDYDFNRPSKAFLKILEN